MKTLKRLLPIWLSLLALAASIAVFLVEPLLLQTLRNGVFDSYQRLRPRQYQPAPVRIVDIDDESLTRIGQWPWPRTQVADLVGRLQELGASAIALDIVFAEPDRTSPVKVFERWMDDPELGSLAARLPDHDQVLAERIGRGGVVTSFVLTQTDEGGAKPAVKGSMVTAGDDPKLFLPAYSGSVNSLPELEEAAVGNGAMNVAPSPDGVVRRVQLLLQLGETTYPTLTAEALRVARGASGYLVKSSGASGESRFGGKTGIIGVRVGDLPVATNAEGAIWLHYTGVIPERSIAAWKVLEGEIREEAVRGAVVFVGTSAAGLKDLRFSPLGDVIAGAEMHAQAVEQMLQGTYLRRPDWAKAAELLFMVAMWAVLVVMIFRLGALPAAAVGILAVGGALFGSWLAFSELGLLLDPVYPSLMSVAVFLVCSISRQLQIEGEKRWIREAFASYISPNLVEYLIDNPDALEVGGVRRECSFVLSDLQGFTSLVEKSDPEKIVALLNEYLEGMVSIALGHDGTLDRIVGDAVAVMFSAPVPQPDHGQRAVACALELDKFATGFMIAKQAEGIPIGITRIGVNTGTVTIGNVGGDTFFDYRALGDAINTAARLETVNNQLGTRVCVSGSTVALCPEFIGRPVGALVLKGKTEGVEAFEPMSAERASSPEVVAYLEAFELMRREDLGAEAAFAALVESQPEDRLAAFHLARLRRGETGVRVVLEKK